MRGCHGVRVLLREEDGMVLFWNCTILWLHNGIYVRYYDDKKFKC